MKRSIKLGSRTIPVWLLIAIIVATTTAITWHLIGTIEIEYTITPPQTENPTITPTSLGLDLGTIPYASSGTKDFGKVATLILPATYTIDCVLDHAGGFETLEVWIKLYRFGIHPPACSFYMKWEDAWGKAVSDQHDVEAGDYDLYVEVAYTAKLVDTKTSGTVQIDIQYAEP